MFAAAKDWNPAQVPDARTTFTASFAASLILAGIANIIDADGPYEVELRSADINVRAVLNQLDFLGSRREIVD